MRAINCCMKLKDFDKCLNYCDKYLELVPEDNNVMEIKKEAIKSKVILFFVIFFCVKCINLFILFLYCIENYRDGNEKKYENPKTERNREAKIVR